MPWHPTGMPSVCTAARRVAPSPAWRAGLHSAAAARTPPAHLCQHRAKEVSAKAVDACCQLLARDRRGGRPELQRREGAGRERPRGRSVEEGSHCPEGASKARTCNLATLLVWVQATAPAPATPPAPPAPMPCAPGQPTWQHARASRAAAHRLALMLLPRLGRGSAVAA